MLLARGMARTVFIIVFMALIAMITWVWLNPW